MINLYAAVGMAVDRALHQADVEKFHKRMPAGHTCVICAEQHDEIEAMLMAHDSVMGAS